MTTIDAMPLTSGELSTAERKLVERIEDRRGELVEIACELIGYDTTTRAYPDEPARQEQDLQSSLAARLQAAGANVDLWEPDPADIAEHPLTAGRTFRFDGRPQLAARLAGTGGGRSVIFNGHIDVVLASIDDWGHDPFQAQVRDGRRPRLRPPGRRRRLCDRYRADRPGDLAGVPRQRLLRDRARRSCWPRRAGARPLARRRRRQRNRQGAPPARRRGPAACRVAQPRRLAPSVARPPRQRPEPPGVGFRLAWDDPRSGRDHPRRTHSPPPGRHRRVDPRRAA